MNKMVSIRAGNALGYEDDGYGWAMMQGALIRGGRLAEIDWANVAEEIETMGRSERSAYQSHVEQILLHMLKWEAQPPLRGISWWLPIMNGRRDAQRVLQRNPSLKSIRVEIHQEALEDARYKAALETDIDAATFEAISFSIDEAFAKSYVRPAGND